jgi:hypothetical protein
VIFKVEKIENVGIFEYQSRPELAAAGKAASSCLASSSGFLDKAVRS